MGHVSYVQAHLCGLRRVWRRLLLLVVVLTSQPPERVPGRDEPRQTVPRRDDGAARRGSWNTTFSAEH